MSKLQETYIQPYSNEAETAVLGALLIESDSFYDVNQILTADMFYNDINKTIYQTLVAMHKDNMPVDMLTLSRELQNKKLIDQNLNPLYIANLTGSIASSVHIREHALYIKQEYTKRKVIFIAQQALMRVSQGDDIVDTIGQLSVDVTLLEEGSVNTNSLKHIRDFAAQSIQEAINRADNYKNNISNGVTTGSTNLDSITGGWKRRARNYCRTSCHG